MIFWVVQMCDQNSDEKKVQKKDLTVAGTPHQDADGGSPDGMCTAGGRVREGSPPWYGQV